MQQPLRILLACEESTRSAALSAVLQANAGEVELVSTADQAISDRSADVLVVDEILADDTQGLELCAEVRGAGSGLPLILMAREPGYELCRRANQLGVVEVVEHFAPAQLVRAITGLAAIDDIRAGLCRQHHQRYATSEFTIRRALHDLATFLEDSRVAPAHVARVSCAAAEVLDNVQRHAYGEHESGFFSIQVDVRRVGVRLTIRDFGRGFDVEGVRLNSVPAALPGVRRTDDYHVGGLVRASRLSESMRLEAGAEGSTVELAFELTLSAIAPGVEPQRRVTTDEFHPRRLRRLVVSLRQGTAPWDQVTPALTLTLERLLGRATARREKVTSR